MGSADAGARRAALLLHGLPAPDRRRSLQALDDEQRSRLRPLLDELRELGVPAGLAGVPARVPVAGPVSPRQRAAAFDAQTVAACLAGRSPATIALLLGAADWPWRQQVVDSLPPADRRKLLEPGRAPHACAPAVLDALCAALCQQADGLVRTSRSRLQPLRKRFERFLPWKS